MGKLKVLVVEDSREIQAIYKIGLTDAIFDKRFVENGVEGLEIYENWRPDIVLLDIMIPGMSGYNVLKEIRDDRGDWTTAIVMATCISGADAVAEMAKLGIQGYLVKPFTHKEIGCKILGYYHKVNPGRAAAATALLDECRRRNLRL
ncbi:MAG: PleD family two-component system response regulator [Syntrophobacteraceae bacterium]